MKLRTLLTWVFVLAALGLAASWRPTDPVAVGWEARPECRMLAPERIDDPRGGVLWLRQGPNRFEFDCGETRRSVRYDFAPVDAHGTETYSVSLDPLTDGETID